MQVESLSCLEAGSIIDADIVIVGSGPAGLTIAREFFGTSISVLILESGQREEDHQFNSLNTVECIGEPKGAAQRRAKIELYAGNSSSWSIETQPFAIRCRVLGGSSHAWMGKSSAFDALDFAAREWVPYSGWPFGLETLAPYLDRAAESLNLGPNCYDERLWELMGADRPEPRFDPTLLESFFWQFARSRIDKLDIMRFGPEFLTFDAPNVRILLNATVTRIDTNEAGSAFRGLEVSTIDGARSRVRAKAAVLAASAIENPRLLLVSNQVHRNGLGNHNDVVGRFLMDHPTARLGRFTAEHCSAIINRFGFFGVRHRGRTHMYMHGLALSKVLQRREKLMNCAVFMSEEHAPDDPWDAFKRLLRRKSHRPMADLAAIASSPGLLAKGMGMRLFESDAVPQRLKQLIVDAVIRCNPNFVAREFQSRGVPHKLTGIRIDGITEQPPHPESRITLSDKTDALGVPMARINWRIGTEAPQSLLRLGQLLAAELPRVGLPAPHLDDWVAQARPEDGNIIEIGHPLGATRMADNPKLGVVSPRCQVHGVAGLYVAGSSVFPTGGHANPTLMVVALAIRLADQIKVDLARQSGFLAA